MDKYDLLECERGRLKRALRELGMDDIESAEYHSPEEWHKRLRKEGDRAMKNLNKTLGKFLFPINKPSEKDMF